jgi:hypothetical protein
VAELCDMARQMESAIPKFEAARLPTDAEIAEGRRWRTDLTQRSSTYARSTSRCRRDGAASSRPDAARVTRIGEADSQLSPSSTNRKWDSAENPEETARPTGFVGPCWIYVCSTIFLTSVNENTSIISLQSFPALARWASLGARQKHTL